MFRLYASTRQEEVAAWGWNAAQQSAFLRMQFAAQQRSYAAGYPDADHCLILWLDEPVGRLIVSRTEQEIRLVDIALLPEYRNRGIGTCLVRELAKESQASRTPLRLQVLKGNKAFRLYSRLGFSISSEDELYFQMEWNPVPSLGTRDERCSTS